MNIRASRTRIPGVLGLIALSLGNPCWASEEIRTVPYLPLAYEVLFAPTPVKGEAVIKLVYELHITNILRGPVSLRSVEMLDEEGTVIQTYRGDRLSECLVRPGQTPGMKDKSVLEGGTRAVLFTMLSFGGLQDLPDVLIHRITVEYSRSSGETVLLRGVGAKMPIGRNDPPRIGPPVRPGVWLAGNGAGDGPVGHRLSLQAWNGRLVVNQRYALDFMKFSEAGRLVHGDSSSNSQWPSYGQEVLAVADGVVIGTKDGVIENTPGAGYAVANSLDQAAGNTIILRIGTGSYAVYAHLQPGSLRVKSGDRVGKGQVLGLIGNSGISDAPHLHFHLIDSDSVFGGESIPFVFEGFELMGPFGNIDDNLDRRWVPKVGSSRRFGEIPLGDVVIRFSEKETAQ
jgi:hypothetical protein